MKFWADAEPRMRKRTIELYSNLFILLPPLL
jgi:hypothetical protein